MFMDTFAVAHLMSEVFCVFDTLLQMGLFKRAHCRCLRLLASPTSNLTNSA